MPRFYFTVRGSEDRPDRDGTELPDIVAARAQAERVAANLLREAADELRQSGRLWVDVTDEDGALLMVVEVGARER